MTNILSEAKRGNAVKEYSPPRKATKKLPPRKVQGGSLFKPSQSKTPVPGKIMKGLGFKPAHAVEGNAYIKTGQAASGIKQFALKHAPKLISAAKVAGRVGGTVLKRGTVAGLAYGAYQDLPLIAKAAKEGVGAVKAYADAESNKRSMQKRYGTMERAAAERKKVNRRNTGSKYPNTNRST